MTGGVGRCMGVRAGPDVTGFFDAATNSVAYVCVDPRTRRCAVIDPVLDFDRNARATYPDFANGMLGFVRERARDVEWILDTQLHAGHFSAAPDMQDQLDAPMAIGSCVVAVQRIWKQIYNLPNFPADGSQWDRRFDDGERLRVAELEAEVLFTPSHTAASIAYRIGVAAFVHDTLVMPDGGTARADFPVGDAGAQWRSIRRLLDLPPETRIFTGQDYMPGGRKPRRESTVAEQRAHSIHVRDGITEEEFGRGWKERDAGRPLPAIMLDALQVDMRGGRLPEPKANEVSYLKIPLKRLLTVWKG